MEIQELPSITRFIPKILLALTVTVCDEVYKKIAYWLNDMGKRHTKKSLGTLSHYLLMILIQIVCMSTDFKTFSFLFFEFKDLKVKLFSDFHPAAH